MSDGPISKRDIAIIGMACVFPGAKDLRTYWENIMNKVDAVDDPPPDWEQEFYYDPSANSNDRTYCKRGGYLGPLAAFDPAKYGVMPNVVDGAEPDHFLSLKAAHDALADAGYLQNPQWRERTEVVIGRGTYVNRGNTNSLQHVVVVDSVLRVLKQLHPDYTDEELAEIKKQLKASLPPFHADTAAGLVPNIISGRIANRLDLMGPNYIVDAACASSLVAIDLGVRDLQSGRCDMAVVGGVNASVPPVIMTIFSQLSALSKTSRIRPFDSGADGTLLGEGVGMLVLKRLADAERDADRVYAVVKGIGVASDGRAIGLLAPRLEGEELALRRAYEDAGVDPATVGLIEAHGTGTLVGDAVEVEALRNVLGERRGEMPRCALGSVKSMISHTMPAAGAAGVIKAALALHHKVLPPTLHCEHPNPKLGLDQTNLYINTETRPWIHGSTAAPRRAGVNAFGFGGINAHTVLEEYTGPHAAPSFQQNWDTEFFVISAPELERLADEVAGFRAAVAAMSPEVPLKDIAWTWNCTRPLEKARLAIVASSRDDLLQKIDRALPKLRASDTARIRTKDGVYYFRESLLRQGGKLAVVFPGEGAQYINMLADLCIHFPEARRWFDLMDRAFENHQRGYRLSDFVYPPPLAAKEDRLWSMDIGAEAVFSANMGLWAVLESLGIQPDAMAGHSTGEHSALLAAGVVETPGEEALIRHILGVNRVFQDWSSAGRIPNGILLAVAGADRKLLDTLIERHREHVFIALDNCPHQMVLFGSDSVVEEMRRALDGGSAICQELPFDRAYHTPWFRTFAASVLTHFQSVGIARPQVRLYSCVTAAPFPDDPDAIRELAAVHWASTVRFRETVERMYEDGVRFFVEAGPRGNLTTFIDDTLRGRPYAALPANVQHRTGIHQLHHLLAQLTAHGCDLRLEHLYARRSPRHLDEYGETKPLREKALRTGLQPLRLPEGFSIRKPEPMREAPRSPAAPDPVPSPQPIAPWAQPSPQPARVAVMERHLSTMEQFLQMQEQVMSAYFAARGAKPSGRPSASSRPFLTEVLDHEPGVRIRARHVLSMERDVFLQDHTLGRNISESDPGLAALPVVPFTVTMEVMAQAASLLLPGKVVTGMREVRGSRWISLHRGDTAIEVVAEKTAEAGAVRVRVHPGNGEAMRPTWAECVVVLADGYPAAPPPSADALRDPRRSGWKSERLYTEGMFHGPRFRAVKTMDVAAANGTVATLEVLPREDLTASAAAGYLTDPIILDAAGQVVAFWSQEVLLPEGDIFPYRLERLDSYRPPSPAGTKLECRVVAHHVDDMVIHSDIEIVDGTGALHYRLKNWEDRRFSLPASIWRLRIAPQSAYLSEPWNEALGPAEGHGLVCCRLREAPVELLQSSHGIWLEMLAFLTLSRAERAEWKSLQATEKRRIDWLLGRCVAKDAVRFLARRSRGIELRPADVEIRTGAHGRPFVSCTMLESLGVTPQISFSHSEGNVVALASPSTGDLVGVDIEPVGRDAESLQTLAFGDEERRLLAGVDERERPEWSIRLWCAKEAAAKALGVGLTRGLQSVRGSTFSEEDGVVGIELGESLLQEFPELEGRCLLARTMREDGVICSTLVWGRRGL